MKPPLPPVVTKKVKAPNLRASSQDAASRKSMDQDEEPVKLKKPMLIKRRIIKPRTPSPEAEGKEDMWMAISTQP